MCPFVLAKTWLSLVVIDTRKYIPIWVEFDYALHKLASPVYHDNYTGYNQHTFRFLCGRCCSAEAGCIIALSSQFPEGISLLQNA